MTWLKRKQTVVEAYQNDGTDARAFAIAEWIKSNGGKATAYFAGTSGEYHMALPYAIVRLDDEEILTRVIGPDWWVVNMGDGGFVAVPDHVMEMAYDIVSDNVIDEPPC